MMNCFFDVVLLLFFIIAIVLVLVVIMYPLWRDRAQENSLNGKEKLWKAAKARRVRTKSTEARRRYAYITHFTKAIKHQTMNDNDEEKKAKQKKTKKQVMCVVLFIFVFCA